MSGRFDIAELIECGDSFARYRARDPEFRNWPLEQESEDSLRGIIQMILDPLSESVGKERVTLTSGFRSLALVKAIESDARKTGCPPRIFAPKDQHCASERDQKGALICDRGGCAVDLRVEGWTGFGLGNWIAENSVFDRMYLYGAEASVHVSIASVLKILSTGGREDLRESDRAFVAPDGRIVRPKGAIVEMKRYGRRLLPRVRSRDWLAAAALSKDVL